MRDYKRLYIGDYEKIQVTIRDSQRLLETTRDYERLRETKSDYQRFLYEIGSTVWHSMVQIKILCKRLFIEPCRTRK